jgi:beta-N-acetylhexosaminidase
MLIAIGLSSMSRLNRQLSRRRFLIHGSQAAAAGLLMGCAAPVVPLTINAQAAAPLLWSDAGDRPPLPANAHSTYPMPMPTLDAKIGQMLMVGFRGLTAPDDSMIIRNIREQHVGAVVLFDNDTALNYGRRNIASSEQVKALVRQLQAAAGIPLLIAIDQEGGKVNRLKERYGFPPSPPAAYYGVMNDLEKTDAQADVIASTLADLGINLNLAPVVDLNVNPNNPIIGKLGRSISGDPEIVAAHAAQFIEAHHRHHVMCTLKHFPGHGSSVGDTHKGLVDVTDTWSVEELAPFQALIGEGLADAIMTAHIFNATLDPDLPATLSHAVITDLLRKKMGYDGVVISDDMQMGAISRYYDFDQAVQAAVLAGVDIIAMANNIRFSRNVAERAANAIRNLVDTGKISEARIDQSYRRIMALKLRIRLGQA